MGLVSVHIATTRTDAYLLSSSFTAPGWMERMRMMCVNRDFHTPSLNSCNRSTVRSGNMLRPGRQSMNAFFGGTVVSVLVGEVSAQCAYFDWNP